MVEEVKPWVHYSGFFLSWQHSSGVSRLDSLSRVNTWWTTLNRTRQSMKIWFVHWWCRWVKNHHRRKSTKWCAPWTCRWKTKRNHNHSRKHFGSRSAFLFPLFVRQSNRLSLRLINNLHLKTKGGVSHSCIQTIILVFASWVEDVRARHRLADLRGWSRTDSTTHHRTDCRWDQPWFAFVRHTLAIIRGTCRCWNWKLYRPLLLALFYLRRIDSSRKNAS